MPTARVALRRVVFPTNLGWMAMAGSGDVLWRLVFGHRSVAAAERALGPHWLERSRSVAWNAALRRLLQRYAAGQYIEFDEVPVECGASSEFARRVLQALRRVGYSRTTTYAALAAEAGSPKAARAVGNRMAANPIPLVVPCHRVVCSSGRIGYYSAVGGVATKRRLLEMERRCIAGLPPVQTTMDTRHANMNAPARH